MFKTFERTLHRSLLTTILLTISSLLKFIVFYIKPTKLRKEIFFISLVSTTDIKIQGKKMDKKPTTSPRENISKSLITIRPLTKLHFLLHPANAWVLLILLENRLLVIKSRLSKAPRFLKFKKVKKNQNPTQLKTISRKSLTIRNLTRCPIKYIFMIIRTPKSL